MNNIHSKIIAGAAAAVLFLTANINAQTPAQNQKESVLTLEKCIEITLKNNPRIAAAASSAQSQRNRLSQSKAGYFPQISASANYRREDSKNAAGWKGAEDNYTSSVSASQMIYDFGKTGLSADIQKNTYYASLQESEGTANDIIYQLKQAYIAVLAAEEQRDVFRQSVEQYEAQLKRAKAFYDVGTRPKIDVTTATVNLNNAKLNLIKAENALAIARQRLLNVMGTRDQQPADFKLEKQSKTPDFKITLEEALRQAFDQRQDLASYNLRLESARQNVKLSRAGHAPELNASASYSWTGDDFPLYDGWRAGASVSLPLFSGFSTVNKVEESKNALNTAYFNLTDAQQNALLDVRTCYSNLQEAASRIPVADISRRQAQENYDLAVGRYTVGVGNYIEVKDAEVSLSNAKLSYISAVFDYNLAIADLKRAMGTR
jgi:TolC family type I secretion outer membrane protein